MTDTAYNTSDEWNSEIVLEKTGDFYQCYKNGELLFDERFAHCNMRDGVLWLENTESQWGIADYDGNMVIPFGERGDRDTYTKILDSYGNFGFYSKENDIYEFRNYEVVKGKIPE